MLSACDWERAGYVGPQELPDSFVDMSGPGADRSPFGAAIDVVLRFVPQRAAPVGEVDAAIRRETLRIARDLAATTLDDEPPDEVRPTPGPSRPSMRSLPAVVAIVCRSRPRARSLDTFWRGEPLGALEPTVFDPREILGGRLTNGAYDWPAVRNVTAAYQDSALLRELFEAHGQRLRFAGVVVAPGYLDTAGQKQRSAAASAEPGRPARRRRRDLHDVLLGELAHRHDADRPCVRAAGDRHGRAGV